MKNHDKILLIGMLTTVLLVSINHVQTSIANNVDNVVNANNTINITPETLMSTISEGNEIGLIVLEKNTTYEVKKYTTKNGFELEIGTVLNMGESKEVEVNILSDDGKWIIFMPYIRQNQIWNYAKVNNMIILPKESGLMIDPFNTSYYKTNKQLRISLDGHGTEIFIYTDKKPTRVSSSTNVHWKYDKNTKFLELKFNSINYMITIDWTEYPLYGTLFVEDRAEIEELDYYLKNLKNTYKGLEEEDGILLYEIGSLNNEIASLNSIINEKKEEKIVLENDINEINTTKEELRSTVMDNTLLSPIRIILIVMWIIVLVSYLSVFQIRKIKVIIGEE